MSISTFLFQATDHYENALELHPVSFWDFLSHGHQIVIYNEGKRLRTGEFSDALRLHNIHYDSSMSDIQTINKISNKMLQIHPDQKPLKPKRLWALSLTDLLKFIRQQKRRRETQIKPREHWSAGASPAALAPSVSVTSQYQYSAEQ